jgi:flagellar motor component MotA
MSDELSYKFSACRTIATAGVSFIVAGTLNASGDAMIFIHIPSFMFVCGICFFLLLGSFGADFLKFIPASFMSLAFSPSRPSPRYAEIAKFGSRYVIAGGVISGLLGVIITMQNLFDPASLGMGMAVSLIAPFYAVLASELFFALVYKAFSDSPPSDSETKPLPLINLIILVIVFSAALGIFFVFLGTR